MTTQKQYATLGVIENSHRRIWTMADGAPMIEYNLGRVRTCVACLPDGTAHVSVLLDGKEVAGDTFTPHPEGFADDGTPNPRKPEWHQ